MNIKEKAQKIACALWGHPPILETCFGYCHCARCNELLGDMIGGCYSAHNELIVGHGDCKTCKTTALRLRWRDRVLLPSKAASTIKLLRG